MDLPKELEDGENNIVHVAEARSFSLLGVMKSSRPVDAGVGGASVESFGGSYRS